MRHTKLKRFSAGPLARFILALACALFLAQGIAIAEEAPPLRRFLEIRATVKPAELVAPGDVFVTFAISNPSDYDANNISFASSDGLHTELLGQIPAGGSQVFPPRVYAVSQAELDAGEIAFIVSHDDIASDEAPVNYTVPVAIIKSAARPDIEFTRQISSRTVAEGAAVAVTYRLKNTGNVPLTQIRVRDELGEYAGRVDVLEPGEARALSNRVTLNKAAVSKASISYVAEAVSGDARTKSLDDAPISVASEGLAASLVLDRSAAAAGERVNGVLTIAAQGVDFSGIEVTDAVYGIVLADALELKAGATITLTCGWPVRQPSDYRIQVSGTAATGNKVETFTNTAHVALTGGFSESALSVSAVAATPVISKPGGARVTVAIENKGNAAARNVTLSEVSLGEIRTFALIPTGEPTHRDVLCDVADEARFVFAATYEDEAGQAITILSQPVEIKVAPAGAPPEVAQPQDEGFVGWILRRVDDAITYVWMLGIAGAALIILTVALIASHFRERRLRRQKLDKEKQRRREELGKTMRFAPVKRPTKRDRRGGSDV